MATKPIPPPDVPAIDPATGRWTEPWYDYLLARHRLAFTDLADVSPTAPTNGQVPIWNSGTSKWTPGAN